jgi:hypothetical protein
MGYSAIRLELEIEFRQSGDIYLYRDVPGEEYRDFMAAESKGEYLNRIFKPKGYRYIVLKRGKVVA